jgi:hypothetical protein
LRFPYPLDGATEPIGANKISRGPWARRWPPIAYPWSEMSYLAREQRQKEFDQSRATLFVALLAFISGFVLGEIGGLHAVFVLVVVAVGIMLLRTKPRAE